MSREFSTRQRWDINDYAFLEFGKRKGFTYIEISQAMSRSPSSVAQKGHELNQWEKGAWIGGKKKKALIDRAMQLAFAVKSNVQGDQNIHWMKKLSATRGIEYNVSPVEEAPAEQPPQEEVVDAKPLPPLVQFSISTEAVIAVVKAWRGQS